ncbi:hypothetical protein GCM10007387_56030 [Pseudoduganella albidiflava]|uniref:Uncharacterized protein n=1 Tax=Pseudoduganella albidiflava TaxID=321983 RepID=A0AA88C5R1_9BURK|nr:hypothetical protein GCM10007387_56030 [Pseudoduganella albidiflava]
MGLDFQQAQFEDLEQADGTGADDDGIRFMEATWRGADDIHDDFYPVYSMAAGAHDNERINYRVNDKANKRGRGRAARLPGNCR